MTALLKRHLMYVIVPLLLFSGCESSGNYSKKNSSNKSSGPQVAWLKINGESMLPTLQDGQIIHVAPYPFKDLKHGNIVVYKDKKGRLISHRIYERTPGSWHAKGDNNRQKDTTIVTPKNYYGVVYTETKAIDTIMKSDGRKVHDIREVYAESDNLFPEYSE